MLSEKAIIFGNGLMKANVAADIGGQSSLFSEENK